MPLWLQMEKTRMLPLLMADIELLRPGFVRHGRSAQDAVPTDPFGPPFSQNNCTFLLALASGVSSCVSGDPLSGGERVFAIHPSTLPIS